MMIVVILVLNYVGVQIYCVVGIGEIIAYLDQIRTGKVTARWQKVLKFILRMGFVPAFIGLSIDDPVKGFVFARGGTLKARFTRDDWGVFVLSNLIGGAVWVGFWGGAIFTIKELLSKLGGLF